VSTAALRAPSATDRMLRGPLAPTLLRLAAPNVIGLFAFTLMTGFDGWLVGRLGNDALAGVAMVLPLSMLMLQMAAGALGGSTTAGVARALGSGQPARATQLARHGLLLALAASAVFTLLGAHTLVYEAMGARGGVLEQAGRYAAVLFAGAAAVWSLNVLSAIARGTGEMLAASLALVGSALLHVTLAPLLVFGAGPVPPLGVAGAAASTVACNALAALVLLAWLSRPASPLRLLHGTWRFDTQAVRPLLAIALPSSLNPLLSNASIALATVYMATFGSIAVAAYGIAARLEYILVPIAFGMGSALTAVVAANMGARQGARAKRAAWTGAGWVWAVTGLIGLAAAVWPQGWMTLFTADAAVREAGAGYLRLAGASYGFYGLALALYFASQGAGRLAWPVMASSLRFAVVAVGGWIAVQAAPGTPSVLHAVVALSLAVMGIALAAAIHMADWEK
jgi:putative MATE family efflux protein